MKKLNIIKDTDEKNLLVTLTEPPKKEPTNQMPSHRAVNKNFSHQIDLLFLPDDNGYRYLLVCVDIATRLCDAEPLKTKNSVEVKNALLKIYKRKILSLPKRIEHDPGSEFEGTFHKYFDKITTIFKKVVGRSRSQAVVESKNKQIGTILNKKMLADEINNDAPSKEWVKIVPKLIKLINQEYEQEPYKPDVNKPIVVNDYTGDLLPIGTKVRVKLEKPKDYLSGQRLTGTFRSGDVRWSKETHTITHVMLNPDSPPLYQIDNNDTVAYTKYQLKISDGKEVKPNNVSGKEYAQEILSEKKIKGKVHYEIRWEDNSKTFEPRTTMIKQIPDLIKEYKNKK